VGKLIDNFIFAREHHISFVMDDLDITRLVHVGGLRALSLIFLHLISLHFVSVNCLMHLLCSGSKTERALKHTSLSLDDVIPEETSADQSEARLASRHPPDQIPARSSQLAVCALYFYLAS